MGKRASTKPGTDASRPPSPLRHDRALRDALVDALIERLDLLTRMAMPGLALFSELAELDERAFEKACNTANRGMNDGLGRERDELFAYRRAYRKALGRSS